MTNFHFRTDADSVSHRNATVSQGTTTKSNPPPRKQRHNARQQQARTQLPLLRLSQAVPPRRVLLWVLPLFHQLPWTLYPHKVWGSMAPRITITLQWLRRCRFPLYRLLWKEKGRTTMIMTLKKMIFTVFCLIRDLSATVYIDRLSSVSRRKAKFSIIHKLFITMDNLIYYS